MNSVVVGNLHYYPVKSAMGVGAPQIQVTRDGPAQDRLWMVVDAQGDQITAREAPQLLSVQASFLPDGALQVMAEARAPLIIQAPRSMASVRLFSDPLAAEEADVEANAWMSNLLDRPARLVRRTAATARPYGKGDYGGFGDVASLLIANAASLDALNARLNWPVTMDRFRPNIVLEGAAAFAEDGWESMTIGDVELRVIEPCVRCIMTTIDPVSGRRDLTQQPLRDLSLFRADEGGNIHFGVYAEVVRPGKVSLGDVAQINRVSKVPTYSVRLPDPPEPDQPRVLRLMRAEPAAEGARHLWWRFEDDLPTDIEPGQFISLRAPGADGGTYTRSFTISEHSEEGRLVRLSIRRQRPQAVSDYMVDKAHVGDTILATGVHGDFVLPAAQPRALFLSAGSGITPFLAFLRSIEDTCDIRHIHSEQFRGRTIGLPELTKAQDRLAGYDFSTKWTGQQGRIGQEDLADVTDLTLREIWICGPAAFVTSMEKIALGLGARPENIHTESFVAPPEAQKTGTAHLVFLDDHPPVKVDAGQPLLQGLRAGGLTLPSSCEIGSCKSCMLRLLRGDCHQTASTAQEDTILPCTSYARSTLHLARIPKDGEE